MPIQVLRILKTLAPLVADAGRIVVGLRTAGAAKSEDRIARLEQETIRAGELLKALAEQLQATVQELRAEAELRERLQRKLKALQVIAIVAGGVAIAALSVAIWR